MARKGRDQDWADGKSASRHSAGLGAFFSHNLLLLIFAGICAPIAVMGFVIRVDEAKESPVVGRMVAIGFSALTAALLAWAVIAYVRLVKLVEVFDEGVVWGGGERATWDEIVAAYRAELIYNGSTARQDLTIETEDGRTAVFRMHLSKWDRLAGRIQEEVFERIWPEAKARYDEGEEVEFGPLAISQEGVTVKGSFIPWKRVKKVSVINGHVSVKEKGEEDTHDVPLGSVPNYGVFLRLADVSSARR